MCGCGVGWGWGGGASEAENGWVGRGERMMIWVREKFRARRERARVRIMETVESKRLWQRDIV
jgi:hypothetical protein